MAAVGVMGWAVLRFGRTPVAFAGVISLMFLVFLGFNKQAFCNYYFLVMGGLCCAVAASDAQGRNGDGKDRSEPELAGNTGSAGASPSRIAVTGSVGDEK